ncbi:unnamed protein product [Ixodes pacificus]
MLFLFFFSVCACVCVCRLISLTICVFCYFSVPQAAATRSMKKSDDFR